MLFYLNLLENNLVEIFAEELKHSSVVFKLKLRFLIKE